MSAENIDGVAADAQPRAGNDALVDGVANRGVGRACAFGAHVALGGEPCHQVCFGGLLGENGAPRNGFLHRLQVFGAGMQEEMNMGIDHAGHQCDVAEIDDFSVRGTLHAGSHRTNAIAFDKNLARLQNCSGVNLKQARCVQDKRDWWRCRPLRERWRS